ncbi:MAG: SpoIID/LytB domain-containing protein [Defluviitaleaceae bacterium]|nr:SpoIID/LytB domain-containing protein [Defluviitaleaceae bacterium]
MNKYLFAKAACLLLVFVIITVATPALPASAGAGSGLPGTIRIGLARDFANRYSINIANAHIRAGYDSGGNFSYVTTLQSQGGFTARVSGGAVALYSGNQRVFSFTDTGRGAQIVCANGGTVRLGNYYYRGAVEFRPSGGRISAINVLSPEEYLFGVLPVEMYASFHIEALKAQAVASRTFMVYRMNEGTHSHQGFDLCDTVHCQAYRGAGREHENTTRAVNETRGQMLFHNNTIILAVYFASSGGVTDYSENVWLEARPYLRAVRSIAEHNPPEWTRTFTMAQLTTAVREAGGNIGTATGMSVSRASPLGRVQELTVYGTSGQWRVSGEAIRNFFVPAGGAVMSRNFYIAGAGGGSGGGSVEVSVTDGHNIASGDLANFNLRGAAPGQPVYVFDGTRFRRLEQTGAAPQAVFGSTVTINGSGWGHGVGMSQRGAAGMALMGYNYRQILMHYYTGVEIR